MSNLWTMIRLKLRLMMKRPLVWLFCLVVPVLLSLLAGSTIQNNDFSRVRGGYVDYAKNGASARLTERMASDLLDWVEVSEQEGRRMLMRDEIDGLLIIPEGYGDIVENAGPAYNPLKCDYVPGLRSFASDTVCEHYLMSTIVVSTDHALAEALMEKEGTPLTTAGREAMIRRLDRASAEARAEGKDVSVEIYGYPESTPTRIVRVPDLAIDVMFLSIFALLGRMILTSPATTERLASLPGGLRRDYLSSVVALFIAGMAELLLMVGVTSLLMPEVTRPKNYFPVMITLFLLLIAVGQFLGSFSQRDHFVPASLLLFFSLVAGGAFINMASVWIRAVGQYTPHGWALAQLEGFNTALAVPHQLAIAACLLVAAHLIRKHRAHAS